MGRGGGRERKYKLPVPFTRSRTEGKKIGGGTGSGKALRNLRQEEEIPPQPFGFISTS